MKPIRKSDGYTKEGKKKYKRFFLITKVKSVKDEVEAWYFYIDLNIKYIITTTGDGDV